LEVHVLLRKAHNSIKKSKLEDSEKYFEKGIRFLYKNKITFLEIPRVLANLANIKIHLGKKYEAKYLLEEVVKLNSKYDFAKDLLDKLKSGKFDETIEYARNEVLIERQEFSSKYDVDVLAKKSVKQLLKILEKDFNIEVSKEDVKKDINKIQKIDIHNYVYFKYKKQLKNFPDYYEDGVADVLQPILYNWFKDDFKHFIVEDYINDFIYDYDDMSNKDIRKNINEIEEKAKYIINNYKEITEDKYNVFGKYIPELKDKYLAILEIADDYGYVVGQKELQTFSVNVEIAFDNFVAKNKKALDKIEEDYSKSLKDNKTKKQIKEDVGKSILNYYKKENIVGKFIKFIKTLKVTYEPKIQEKALLIKNEIKPKTKINRNDPCPCGSSKKYKKCCEVL